MRRGGGIPGEGRERGWSSTLVDRMFESLTDRFDAVFARLRGRGRLSEADVDEALREIRLALLQADVNLRVVRDFVGRVRDQLVGIDLSQSLTPASRSSRSSTTSCAPSSAARRCASPTRRGRRRSCSSPACRAPARRPPRPSWPVVQAPARAATRCSSAPTCSARRPSSSSGSWATRSAFRSSARPSDPGHGGQEGAGGSQSGWAATC